MRRVLGSLARVSSEASTPPFAFPLEAGDAAVRAAGEAIPDVASPIGALQPDNAWSYDAEFLLLSWKHGSTRLSARYDRFASRQTSSNFYDYVDLYYGDRGHAWTVACDRQLNAHWNIALEGIELSSWVAQRALIGEAPQATERQLQLAVRYAL